MAQQTFDAVIIGSGAGGAPIAHELARAGKSVLVLEKGPLIRPQYQVPGKRSTFKRDELISDGPEKIIEVENVANRGQPYFSSHAEPDLNDEPHVYRDGSGQDRATIEGYTAQLVGGGTNLYGGVSFRFTPTDLKLQTFNAGRTLPADPGGDVERESRDWAVDYDALEPYYVKTEQLVGLNGTVANQLKPFSEDSYHPPLAPNPISRYAREGMEILGRQIAGRIGRAQPVEPYRTPLAVITRDHTPSGRTVPKDPETAKTSYVNRYGDPLGLKSSTWVSLLSPLQELPNFAIYPNCTVTHLSSDNSRVTEVHFLDPGGQPRTVSGKVVVVACSAIESVRLLKLSALLDANFDRRIHQNDLLGAYFLTHAFGGAAALTPDRSDKSKALDADWATDCCNDDAFLKAEGLWAGATLYNNTSDSALPLSLFRTIGDMDLDNLWQGLTQDPALKGQKLIEHLDMTLGRKLSITFMANQVPQRGNRILLHPTIRDKWNRPVAYIEKGWHSHDIHLMNHLAQQCGDVLRFGCAPKTLNWPILGQGGSYQAPNGLVRIANHVLGGARFGTRPDDSVLDPDCRAWSFDNLYVTDGAFMPTSGSGNPTHTIEANSFRVADALLKAI
ncbi:GMC family oxidoreductase [Longimicrobium sp.]|jgi:choline dehydrogenase-like flavoprotein|uniref:GMC family oxidoreductase n=1 Tax=Longimicrobium sp. TaxID=2029185 RepID=UPI002F93E915